MMVDDHRGAFIAAMEAAGVPPAQPIAHLLVDGKLIRFRVDGDRAGRENGWAVYHGNHRPAGAFGCNKRQIGEKWRADAVVQQLSPAERRERARQFREAARRREQEKAAAWEAAAARAERQWASAAAANPAHPYLVRKGIAGDGLRQAGQLLLVPMCDIGGKLWNLQRIDPDGGKRFMPGARVSGLMFRIGEPERVVCIGEGVGTMAAVRRATGYPVVAAFNAKNLTPVALAVRQAFGDCDLVLCGDDDAHLIDHPHIKRNLGLEAATAAALAVGGRVAVPPRSANHG